MDRLIGRLAGLVVVALLLPVAAYAQATITGVVRDASGGVLPGVTVEAVSPVLIEKIRTVVTDATGQYRIVNLLPGTYSVTFTLAGFSTVKRDGIVLTGTFVASINADLKLGALEETILVTSETPVVDVQSARVQQAVSKDVLEAVPTARTAIGIQALIPGISGSGFTPGSDVGGTSGTPGGGTGAIHGGRQIDSRSLTDGLTTNAFGGGGGGGNNANVAGAQEVVISTSGGLGEAETSGVTVNIIPRDGANTFSGTFFANGANGAMQSSNYTQALKDRGVIAPSRILKVFDVNPMGGGRIIRDRLWFFVTGRWWGADNTVPGLYFNKNAGDPSAWTYEPDLSRQAFVDFFNSTAIGRLTWQATPRNKFTAYWSEQYNCRACRGGGAADGNTSLSATTTIEATPNSVFKPSRIQQFTYSSPISSRLLIEAAYGAYLANYGNAWDGQGKEDGTNDNPLLIRVVEQGGSIPGLTYRQVASFTRNTVGTRTWRASISYVTGAHNMKAGYFGGFTNPVSFSYNLNELIAYRFNNVVPNQLTQTGAYPDGIRRVTNLVPTSFYAQDQWTSGRLTLQGGVRYDHLITSYPDQQVGGTRIIPTVIRFPSRSTSGVNWNDITPRMGVVYDLFGSGKTALKLSLGKYMEAYSVVGGDNDLNPIARIAVQTTRSWNDANRDYVPQCDLTNPAANLECGAMVNQNLGKNVISRTFDPAWSSGWGNRPSNWGLGASVQQELLPRVSMTVGYFRNTWGNLYVVDNRANSLSDWTPFSLTAPVDPRLPNGGGQTIGGLYNLVPEKVGQVDELAQPAGNFAKQTENWQGVDVTFTARLGNATVQGGTSTGRRLADNCAIRAQLPELGLNVNGVNDSNTQPNINAVNPTNPYCRVVEPYRTSATGLATYVIPRVGVQVSGTWQTNPGPALAANYNAPNAVVRPSLGRDLSGGAANVTVNLIAPGTLYADRINQLDFRVAKLLRFGRTRAQFSVDLYNALNTDVPLTYNQTFVPGGPWLTPTSVMAARFVKVGMQIDFE